jgi:hypothetical protein
MDTQKAEKIIMAVERYAPVLDDEMLEALDALRAESKPELVAA